MIVQLRNNPEQISGNCFLFQLLEIRIFVNETEFLQQQHSTIFELSFHTLRKQGGALMAC